MPDRVATGHRRKSSMNRTNLGNVQMTCVTCLNKAHLHSRRGKKEKKKETKKNSKTGNDKIISGGLDLVRDTSSSLQN